MQWLWHVSVCRCYRFPFGIMILDNTPGTIKEDTFDWGRLSCVKFGVISLNDCFRWWPFMKYSRMRASDRCTIASLLMGFLTGACLSSTIAVHGRWALWSCLACLPLLSQLGSTCMVGRCTSSKDLHWSVLCLLCLCTFGTRSGLLLKVPYFQDYTVYRATFSVQKWLPSFSVTRMRSLEPGN